MLSCQSISLARLPHVAAIRVLARVNELSAEQGEEVCDGDQGEWGWECGVGKEAFGSSQKSLAAWHPRLHSRTRGPHNTGSL